jgi:hypothetical protein
VDYSNYVEDDGDNNWLDLKIEYVLPMGSMKNDPPWKYEHNKTGRT